MLLIFADLDFKVFCYWTIWGNNNFVIVKKQFPNRDEYSILILILMISNYIYYMSLTQIHWEPTYTVYCHCNVVILSFMSWPFLQKWRAFICHKLGNLIWCNCFKFSWFSRQCVIATCNQWKLATEKKWSGKCEKHIVGERMQGAPTL